MGQQYFSNEQKLNLAKSLITKSSPAYVQFYITARCNLSCEQCNIIYANAESGEMSIPQIQKMAENMAEIGVCMVLLIGGEPFYRKDIHEIVAAFTKVGIHVRLQTNGLATRVSLERCIEAGAHDISISLDALEPALQDTINGAHPESWQRAIKTIATVNEVFPENGTAFFGTVLMPRNLGHVPDVIDFATEIGWGVSLVPAHVASPNKPRGFRTFDDEKVCTFDSAQYNSISRLLEFAKEMRRSGKNLYDSDEYLDDIYRFIVGQPLQWRRRNDNVCDSPNLYFAVEPGGNISPCCDYKLATSYPVFHENFPEWYRDGRIHKDVYKYTRNCSGCMYGSYPEITVTARFLKPMFERFFYFNNNRRPKLRKLNANEIGELANEIYQKNLERRNNFKDC